MDQLELTIQGNSGRIVPASRFRVSKNIENQSGIGYSHRAKPTVGTLIETIIMHQIVTNSTSLKTHA